MNRKVNQAEFHSPVFAAGINLGVSLDAKKHETRWAELTMRADGYGIYVRVKKVSKGALSLERFVPWTNVKHAEFEEEGTEPPKGSQAATKAA